MNAEGIDEVPGTPTKQPRSILKTPHKETAKRAAAHATLLSTLPGGPSSPIEFKVLLLGPAGCGKSSVLRACAGEPYAHTYEHSVGVTTRTVLAATFHGRPVYLRLWDVPYDVCLAAHAGSSSDASLSVPLPSPCDALFSGVHAALCLFDARDGCGIGTGIGLGQGSIAPNGTSSNTSVPTRSAAMLGGLHALDSIREIVQKRVIGPAQAQAWPDGEEGRDGLDGSVRLTPIPVRGHRWPLYLLAHKADMPAAVLASNLQLLANDPALDGEGGGDTGGAAGAGRDSSTGPRSSGGILSGLFGVLGGGGGGSKDQEKERLGNTGTSGPGSGGTGRLRSASRSSAASATSSSRSIASGCRACLAPHMIAAGGYLPAPSPAVYAAALAQALSQGGPTALRGGDGSGGTSGGAGSPPLLAVLGVRLALGLGPADLQAYASSAGFRCWWWTSALPTLAWAAVSLAPSHGNPPVPQAKVGGQGRAGGAKSQGNGSDGSSTSRGRGGRQGGAVAATDKPALVRQGSIFGSMFGGGAAAVPSPRDDGGYEDVWAGMGIGSSRLGGIAAPAAPALPSLPPSSFPSTVAGGTLRLDLSSSPAAVLPGVLSALVDDCLEYWGHTGTGQDSQPYRPPAMMAYLAGDTGSQDQDEGQTQAVW